MRWILVILLLTNCSSPVERVNSPLELDDAPSPQASPAPAAQPAPEGWVPYPVPRADSPALRCANHSEHEWKVVLERETLKIRLDTRGDHQDSLPAKINSRSVAVGSKGDRHVIEVADGWLVGLDAGEFGGALWWFDSTGVNSKKLAGENVTGFAASAKGTLALVGRAHLGLDSGKVLLITDGAGGNRKIEVLADLGAAPMAFAAESPGALLVMTTRGLVRVRTSGAVEQLLLTNYGFLYPNSMTLSASGVIHVGMRHFVARLTPEGDVYREEWFVPAGCAKFKMRGYDCVCVSGRK